MSKTPNIAEYAGSISRFLDLHGLVPDATGGVDKQRAELAAFEKYLSETAAKKPKDPCDG